MTRAPSVDQSGGVKKKNNKVETRVRNFRLFLYIFVLFLLILSFHGDGFGSPRNELDQKKKHFLFRSLVTALYMKPGLDWLSDLIKRS